MLKRGDWRPGNFPPLVTLVAKLTLLGLMGVRGADYAWGDTHESARRLSVVEAAIPLRALGALCLVAALVGFAGILLRRVRPLLFAYVSGVAVYAGLAVGVAIDVAHRTPDPWASIFPAGVLGLAAVGLLVLAQLQACHRRSGQMMITSALVCTSAVAVAAYGLDGIRSAASLAGIATIHALMALGTAARARQMSILKERQSE